MLQSIFADEELNWAHTHTIVWGSSAQVVQSYRELFELCCKNIDDCVLNSGFRLFCRRAYLVASRTPLQGLL